MKADYGWIIFLVIGVLLLVFWGSIRDGITGFKNRGFDQEAYDRGEKVFNDAHVWTPLEAKSCAMCHTAGYKEEPQMAKMDDYKPGSPVILKDLSKKYKNDVLDNEDALYEQCMVCMTDQHRMHLSRAIYKSQNVQDLLAYLRAQ